MRHDHKCLLLLAGVLLMLSAPAIVPAQGWMEYPYSDCPKDIAATWRRGYLEGYTQSPSIAQGQTVRFRVSTLAAYIPHGQVTNVQCAMRVYRAVGRTLAGDIDMQMYRTFQASFYPLRDSVGQFIWPDDPHTRFPRDYRRGCDDLWAVTDSFTIPSGPSAWPSGFYYAKLFLPGHEQDSVGYIPFVVRAAIPGSTSKTLCVIAWNTYQAYNWWGGGSLYYTTGVFGSEDSSAGTPSIPVIRKVSFRRPFGVQWIPWGTPPNCGWLLSANQLGQFDNIYNNPIVRMERYFVSWAHEARDTMEFCVDADVNANTNGSLSNYRFVVFPGHSEYWSDDQRRNIERIDVGFKSTGGNIAFFGANNCYWKVDYFPSGTNNPDSMYCDKDWTETIRGGRYLWRRQVDITSGDTLHEARFIGAEFMGVNDPAGNYPNRVKKAEHWVFRGTGLENDGEFGKGSSELLPLAGAEVDRFIASRSPSNTQVLADTFVRVLTDWVHEPHIGEVPGDSVLSSCTYYEDTTTNSRVFAGGGLGWPGCLFGQDSTVMRTLTTNILDHFSGKKYIGNIYRNVTWSQDQLLRDTVEIDGDSRVTGGRQLLLGSGMKVVIDSAVALFVDGELQIPIGVTVTISGWNNKWGNLVIDSAGTLRVKSGATLNLVAPMYFVLETGSNLVLESGATLNIRTVTSVGTNVTITVPSGATLRIDQQGGMYFNDGAQLVAYGSLNAIGTSQQPIVFAKLPSASNWLGIHVASGLIVSELRHCAITDAITGVSVSSSRFKLKESSISDCSVGVDLSGYHPKFYYQIDSNVVQNCWTSGVVIGNASNVTLHDNTISGCSTGLVTTQVTSRLYRNVIQNSSEEGVFAGEYSNPRFGDVLLADPGNNVIRSNAISALHAVNSTPFLGSGCERVYGGWNSVYGDALLVNAEKGAYVSANWNWWGGDPPKAEQFTSDGESWIDYDCWMTYDPNEGMQPSGSPTLTSGGKGGDDPPPILSMTPERAKLLQALSLRGQGDYRRALGVYANLIRLSPNAPEARVALSELRNTFHDFILSSNDSTLQGALEDSLISHRASHPNALMRRLAKALVAAEITSRRDFAAAIAEYNQLLQSATTDIERAMCLFALFNINSQGIRDRSEAQHYLTQLQTLYPTDIRTRIASARFASMIDAQGGNEMQKPSIAGRLEPLTSLPTEFALLQNYPNPFNPSTTIKYNLPIDAHVTLKLYDLLGREVANLVNEQTKGGYHSATLDASKLSSGVYFYRMQAGTFAQTKKLLLLR